MQQRYRALSFQQMDTFDQTKGALGVLLHLEVFSSQQKAHIITWVTLCDKD
jgi:hypothetical protein